MGVFRVFVAFSIDAFDGVARLTFELGWAGAVSLGRFCLTSQQRAFVNTVEFFQIRPTVILLFDDKGLHMRV